MHSNHLQICCISHPYYSQLKGSVICLMGISFFPKDGCTLWESSAKTQHSCIKAPDLGPVAGLISSSSSLWTVNFRR